MNTADGYDVTIVFVPPEPGQLPKFYAIPDPLEVDPGAHLIRMHLITEGVVENGATFAPRGIDWCDKEGMLTVAPAAFALTYSPHMLLLQDLNVEGTHGEYQFIVYVSYLGFTYSSQDPTIINKQPSGEITISFLEMSAAKKRFARR